MVRLLYRYTAPSASCSRLSVSSSVVPLTKLHRCCCRLQPFLELLRISSIATSHEGRRLHPALLRKRLVHPPLLQRARARGRRVRRGTRVRRRAAAAAAQGNAQWPGGNFNTPAAATAAAAAAENKSVSPLAAAIAEGEAVAARAAAASSSCGAAAASTTSGPASRPPTLLAPVTNTHAAAQPQQQQQSSNGGGGGAGTAIYSEGATKRLRETLHHKRSGLEGRLAALEKRSQHLSSLTTASGVAIP